jgi:HEAT repeat protein
MGHEELRDALASPTTDDSLPSLDRFLEDVRAESAQERMDAVAAFSYPGNSAAIPYVGAVLFRLDEEVSVRVAAAEGLGRVGDRRARRFLTLVLRDPDARVRDAAARALVALKRCQGTSC